MTFNVGRNPIEQLRGNRHGTSAFPIRSWSTVPEARMILVHSLPYRSTNMKNHVVRWT